MMSKLRKFGPWALVGLTVGLLGFYPVPRCVKSHSELRERPKCDMRTTFVPTGKGVAPVFYSDCNGTEEYVETTCTVSVNTHLFDL